MKSCPTCHRQYEDETIKFCLEDGSALEPGSARGSAEATLYMPGPTHQSPAPTPTSSPSTMTSIGFQPPAVNMSSSFAESASSRRSPLVWIVIALIIGGSGIAIALILTRGHDGNASGAQNSNLSSSPSPGQNSTESNSSFNATSQPQSANTSEPARPAEKPPTPTTAEIASAKPPKSEAKEATPSPKPAPRGPVSGGVLNGKAVSLVQPAYPAIARSAHASGTVSVQVLIDESGNVISAHAVSGHPLLQSSAVAAAGASKFTPTMLSGVPVKVSGIINYNFQAQ